MVILGINASHTATAALLIDGEIRACVSEERLTRIKSQSGLPILAAKEVLRLAGVTASEVDLLVFGFKDPKVNSGFSALLGVIQQPDRKPVTPGKLNKLGWFVKEQILVNLSSTRHLYNKLLPLLYRLFVDKPLEEQVLQRIEKDLGIPKEKVIKVDHHTAHAYSAIFSSGDFNKKPLLALTVDGMGDGLCSTVRVVKDNKVEVISETEVGNSIGDLYSFITRYLGMKMGEHEYKVMGLAPYANKEYTKKVYSLLRKLIWVNDDLTFGTKIHSHLFYKILPKILGNERFDNVAGAIQLLTEDLMVEWVKKAIKKTGIRSLVCGGGVFMNVKMNQRILELPEVKSMFVMPSCGDESTAIGAAFWGYHDQMSGKSFTPLNNLYLGMEFSEEQNKKALKEVSKRFKVEKRREIEKDVAKLLAKGKVVARFAGRMEWGARALGNRSILSHPANLDGIREINESIKSRDFWMPFAPVILEERQNDYIKNPKGMNAPFMIITFNSTDEGRRNLKAAMHQYDFTLRPQVISQEINPAYYKIIKEFEKLTGIGALLNTSFNLHGFPIVCSPEDALEVFAKSGLKYLALGNFLVSKNV